MKLGAAIAEIMKREGIEILTGYPVNHLIEFAADIDIRPVMVRQERIGLHMADAISRVTSGRKLGAFCMQHGPGSENAYGGVAQCYGESIPVLVLPMGYPRRLPISIRTSLQRADAGVQVRRADHAGGPSAEYTLAAPSRQAAQRSATAARWWSRSLRHVERGGAGTAELHAVLSTRYGPTPATWRAREALATATRAGHLAGTGVHWARAWPQLRELAELLAAPVTTSLGGKSSFPEDHPLALGSGGLAIPKPVRHFLDNADLILGIGCSFTETNFGVKMPAGKKIIHATLDPDHLNKDIACEIGLVGDAGLTLDALVAELRGRVKEKRDHGPVAREIQEHRAEWLAAWAAKTDSDAEPLNPYRVLRDLWRTVDVDNTIITHDAGSPRDQLSPFWVSRTPLSYLGWGKTTQLGYGLGLAMGAKLAAPDKLCINVWGDARSASPAWISRPACASASPSSPSCLNNFSMAIELKVMPVSTEKFRSTDISGDYAGMARAFGGYGERVTKVADIVPAIRRGIEQTRNGTPALLEFITGKETAVSRL